ncbi:hypothetical protein A2V80_03235 [Candidatus Woesebacteria bacterium RBG_16_39_8b]|uniref:Pseudouridine synthase n=1 Tax=Candidatus Woesebacteria bacterium RBG_16_39_8b TaxID=1802482 RepID=A0A1F7XH67_9BACT|nr:MAG: hypothetical protein A2V80_03235 [Candidatus Woesebacteria bacterium RBG_16_39_8b]
MEPKVIFEDDSILVLDKPAGWIVNDAITTKGQNVVQKWLSNMTYPLAMNSEMRSGIVHRLDKETSGILLVAKTKEAFENLQREFKERKVDKTYTALVHGNVEHLPADGEGVINVPVGRLPWNRERFGVLPGGREAVTHYLRIKNYELGIKNRIEKFTLLELKPKTGRTHQIRVHLKYIGHPIVSDEFYAGRKTSRKDKEWCPRLFLHAVSISFVHPVSGKKVSFKSDLSSDLESALKKLSTSKYSTIGG